MRFSSASWWIVGTLAASLHSKSQAFVPVSQRPTQHHIIIPGKAILPAYATKDAMDCGCAPLLLGKPTPEAKAIDAQKIMMDYSVLNAQGESVAMKELLSSKKDDVSIVVFLRSLGWPLCQEFILQWNKQIDELEQAGVQLVMVSIGSVENCQKLVDHLGIRSGYLHVGKLEYVRCVLCILFREI